MKVSAMKQSQQIVAYSQ